LALVPHLIYSLHGISWIVLPKKSTFPPSHRRVRDERERKSLCLE
jgi:hypothetical protein